MLKERKIAAFIDVYNTMLSAQDFDSILKQIDAMGEIFCCKIYGASDTDSRDIVDEIVRRGYDMAPQLPQGPGRSKFDHRIIVDTMETVLQNTNIDVVAIICAPADLVWFFRKLKSYNVGLITGANAQAESMRLADVVISAPALTRQDWEFERAVDQVRRDTAMKPQAEQAGRKGPKYPQSDSEYDSEPVYVSGQDPVPRKGPVYKQESSRPQQVKKQIPRPVITEEPEPAREPEPEYTGRQQSPKPIPQPVAETLQPEPVKKPEPPAPKKETKPDVTPKEKPNRKKESEGVTMLQHYEVDLSRYETIKPPAPKSAPASAAVPAGKPAPVSAAGKTKNKQTQETKESVPAPEPTPPPASTPAAAPAPAPPPAPAPESTPTPIPTPEPVPTPPPQEHKTLKAWSLEEERPDLSEEATNAELLEEIRKLLEEFKT